MSKLIDALNWADWLLIAIIVLSILISIKRGMTREILSVLTWVGAFVISYVLGDELALLMDNWIKTPSLRTTIAMVSLFAITLIVGAMLNHVLADMLKKTGLTGTDRILGSIFGLLRGIIIVVALLLFVQSSFSLDPWWKQSVLVPRFVNLGIWARDIIDGIAQFTQQLTAKT